MSGCLGHPVQTALLVVMALTLPMLPTKQRFPFTVSPRSAPSRKTVNKFGRISLRWREDLASLSNERGGRGWFTGGDDGSGSLISLQPGEWALKVE